MELRRIRGPEELEALLTLREAVFIVEQGVSVEGDRDGSDGEAVQIVAVEEDGGVVGTCRLVLEGGLARFGRLAVREDRRGRGLGARLLAEAELQARAEGAREIVLHAQTHAMGLYARAGYEPYGERFDDEGIEHQAFRKALADA